MSVELLDTLFYKVDGTLLNAAGDNEDEVYRNGRSEPKAVDTAAGISGQTAGVTNTNYKGCVGDATSPTAIFNSQVKAPNLKDPAPKSEGGELIYHGYKIRGEQFGQQDTAFEQLTLKKGDSVLMCSAYYAQKNSLYATSVTSGDRIDFHVSMATGDFAGATRVSIEYDNSGGGDASKLWNHTKINKFRRVCVLKDN